MADDSQTRRRYPRYPINKMEVTLYLASGAEQSFIIQLSLGGCLIFPALPPQPNPSIKMSFRLAPDMPYINCKGEIVYSIMDRGSGVAFREISAYNLEMIGEFLQKVAAKQPPQTT
jgi:PilZ domain